MTSRYGASVPALTAEITVHDALEPGLTEEAWQLYRAAFAGLELLAAQRHLLTVEEFGAVAADPRVTKLLAADPGGERLLGIATTTTDLTAVPLVSPAYYAARWPEASAAGRLHYVGFVGVHPDARASGAFPALVERICRPVATAGGVVAVDVCRYNEVAFGLPASLGRLGEALGGARTVRVDEQVYWAYEFPGRS